MIDVRDANESSSRFAFRSLTTRLITWLLVCCGGVYVLTVALSHSRAQTMAVSSAAREAANEAEAAITQVQGVLRSVEESTDLLATTLETFEPSEAELAHLLRGFVGGNRNIYGSAAAFEPRAFRHGLERFAPYFHRSSDGSPEILFADLASESYRYWDWGWYKAAVATGEPRWSEPYLDEGGGEITMVTYSVPFFRRNGDRRALRGVVTADLHLDWLQQLVQSVRIGQTGYGVVLSRSGRILVHRRDRVVEPGAALLELVDPERRDQVEPIVRGMLAGESGFVPLEIDGRVYRLTYAPVGMAGWSLAVLYPEDELLAGVRDLRSLQAALALVGLGVLVGVVVVLSRRLTHPLKDLAGSAGRIATGDLDATLPLVRSRDEIGALTRSFHHMRDSLKTHIRELQETTAAKERLESELKIARRIQMDMLPSGTAGGAAEGYGLAARLLPARAVGGDLYDHFVQDGRVFFMLGDVSGKGVPAALFMARAKTLFQTVVAREEDPGATLRVMNTRLCADNDAGMFVTAVCGILDPTTGELVFASGGHDAPLLAPAEGPPGLLEVDGGAVLGLLEGADYPVNRLRLVPRDAVVLYTDGVTEAQDAAEEFFGAQRLLEVARRWGPDGETALTEGVFAAVQEFAGEAPQFDDITVLTLSYAPSAGE